MDALNSAVPVDPGSADGSLRPAPSTCIDCSKTLGARNKSGRCRSCLARAHNANPETTAKRLAAVRARFDDPAVVAEHAARLAKYMREMPESDRQARRERGAALYRDVLSRPDIAARATAARDLPETRRRQGLTHSDTMLPWCPRELRPAYREMRAKRLTPAEARAALEPEIPGSIAHARRAIANHQDAQRIRHERDVAQAY